MIQPVSSARVFDVEIEMVPPGATPEQELERLEAHAQNGDSQHLDAVVLDADERGLENAVQWVRSFNDEYLRRQAATYPDTWENALQPQPSPTLRSIPPVLVVLASPSGLGGNLGEFEAKLAAGGAVVYEKPSQWELPANFVNRLREELAETYSRFWADEQSGEMEQEQETVRAPAGEPDLAPYLAPVYQLSEENFEALLERGRNPNPLETGD
jgi:hypothetical protein